jgi:hypothetical protein
VREMMPRNVRFQDVAKDALDARLDTDKVDREA